MRTHPLLARLALPAGAAFRCSERLESREGLAARFAPDLEAGPLVAEDRLRRLVEPPDGSAALQRTLSLGAAPVVAREGREEGEGAVAEWLPLGRVFFKPAPGSGSPDRPLPRPERPGGQATTASRFGKAPVDPRELIAPPTPEAVQAILDGVAPGFRKAGESGAKGAAGSRAARPRQGSLDGAPTGDPLPLGHIGGGFLLQRAAQTPVLIGEPEAPFTGSHSPERSATASSAPVGASTPWVRVPPASKGGETGLALPSRLPARSVRTEDPGGISAVQGSPDFLRGSRALPALSTPSSVGGFRGLAALAASIEGERPEAATEGGAPSPLRPSARFDAPVHSAEGLDLWHDGNFEPWGAEVSADPGASLGPIGADLEAALDHALRRAARRHGIEVLEP